MQDFKSTVSVSQFLQIFIFSGVLALSEAVFSLLVTYSSGQTYGPLFGPGMYLALSAGSFFAFKKFGNLKLNLCPYITGALAVVVALAGFAYVPQMTVLWGIIPFIVFGYILNSFYMTCSLRMLLLAASAGAISVLVLLKLYTVETDACYYPLGIIIALLICGLLNRFKLPNIIAAVIIASVSAYCIDCDHLDPSAGMIRNTPALRDGTEMRPTIITPWIFTDLIRTEEGPYIVTNGSRFSKVVKAPRPPNTWADRPRQPMDEAFLLAKPKTALIIGPAGGTNVGRAMSYDVESIDAVDINPAVFDIMTHDVLRFTRKLYLDPRVHMIVSEGRHFLETTTGKYDIIFIQGVRTGTAFSSIDASMLESYILTPQSIQAMWSHLTDNGIIVLEDYFAPAFEEDKNSSYLKNIQNQLGHFLPITDWDKQSLYYVAQKSNPLQQDDFLRNPPIEVLLLSKQPILNEATVRDMLRDVGFNLDFTPLKPQASALPLPISDDRPFHTLAQLQNILIGVLILASLGILAVIITLNRKPSAAPGKYGYMFVLGIGYILVFMGLLGRAHMILGQPQLSSAVMLFAFYLFSMPAGIWATRITFANTKWATIAAALWTIAIAVIFYLYQGDLIKITSQYIQIAILVGMVALFAALTEIPYIAILAQEPDKETCGKQFTIGKIGSTFGVIFGFCVQMLFGYTAIFIAGFVFLVACVFYYPRAQASQVSFQS